MKYVNVSRIYVLYWVIDVDLSGIWKLRELRSTVMLVDERRSKMLQITELQGFVSLQQLVDELNASESTIRRDLEYLDGIGQLRRTRGGAAYIGDSITAFDERRDRASEQKRIVAAATAELISPGETVLLDGGTTTLEVARNLIGKPLQVVTNSIPIATLLVNQDQTEVIVVGGYLYPRSGVALGTYAVETLRNVNVGKLVMSVAGITNEGLFNSNLLLVETERQMIASADEVIVVADSSKFGQSALARICALEAVSRVVVDSGVTAEWSRVIRNSGAELMVVNTE